MKERVGQEVSEIAFSDLEQWIKKHAGSSFEAIKPQANQFRNKFQTIINSIKVVGKQLEQAEIKEEQVAQQFIPVINDAKNTILSAIQKETSDKLHEINAFEDLLLLRDRAKSLLNRLGETGGSHSRTMHSFFGKYAKILKLELGLLDREMKGVNKLIDSYTEKTSSLDCKESIAKISSAMYIEKTFASKQKEITNEIEMLRPKEPEVAKKIEGFKRTEGYNAYLKSREELQKANSVINNVLSDVNAAFSRISRPVSKYAYEIGLDKESNHLMQSIMENPVNLMQDTKADQVLEVLNKVKEGMQKGRIVTKNPEKDVDNINTLISNLHNYIKQYKEYDSLAVELRTKTSAVARELESMNDELRRIRDDIQQKESYLNEYNQQVTNAKHVISEEIKKISERLERVTKGKVKIVI